MSVLAADRVPVWTKQIAATAVTSSRIASVDALRGFSIFWIIGGDGIVWALSDMSADRGPILRTIAQFVGRQMTHVEWEGLRFYDFIFPLLIFVTGTSIVFSLGKLIEREGRFNAHIRVLRRSLLLYALGIIYYGGASHLWPEVRLLGVLQRIALCYCAASLLFLNLRIRGLIAVFAALLVGYWGLLMFVPVPGIGAGMLVQGENLAHWIDANYLPGLLWYGTWDPEGLLSTLPAIATCLIGVFAGLLLRDTRITPEHRSLSFIIAGLAMVLGGHLWGLQFPVIKGIWTSSYVLVAGGYSLLLLGAMHQLMDVWGMRAWAAFFTWIGANAITLYLLNNVVDFRQFATRFVGGDIGRLLDQHLAIGAARFMSAALGLAIALAIAKFLYDRKVFLRV
jgi:predicted acyltransferase